MGSNEAEEVGESGRGAVTSALGKLLAVAGRRAAGGRTAAARALAALAASGDPGWMEAVPRKGRLRRVLAMLAGPLLPDAEMEGGMMSSSVAADTEGAGFGHDGEERQAAAEAVAAMVGNAEVSQLSASSFSPPPPSLSLQT